MGVVCRGVRHLLLQGTERPWVLLLLLRGHLSFDPLVLLLLLRKLRPWLY
jgi:hypothetical protein